MLLYWVLFLSSLFVWYLEMLCKLCFCVYVLQLGFFSILVIGIGGICTICIPFLHIWLYETSILYLCPVVCFVLVMCCLCSWKLRNNTCINSFIPTSTNPIEILSRNA